MRKYVEIAAIYLKMQMFWRADALFNVIFTISKIIFAYLLWGILFQDSDTIAGFTFQSMLSYYIVSSFLSQMEMSGGISNEISTRIRNGTFSKYMVIPVNIEKYFIAMEIGTVGFHLIMNAFAAALWIFIFQIKFVFTTEYWVVLCAILMIMLGLLFMVQLNYYLGLLTLKYQEVSTFLMIKDNLVAFITGAIIPLALLPETVIYAMKFFPFYYVTYLPAMLLTGHYEEQALKGIFILAGWCIFMELITGRVYEKYRRKFDGVGM